MTTQIGAVLHGVTAPSVFWEKIALGSGVVVTQIVKGGSGEVSTGREQPGH
jgi:hypothetical protein